ncbi:30S ribosomal protein S3, partial [Candidatus Woesearchaeota archaeon]|nr:30S ribosomal protein S3 [Candidatus Woesearchaeota archaeon]
KLENPQVEISEIDEPMLDARVVCERIVRALERFGIARFKRIGHSTLENVMSAGALGIEIHMSGRIPGARAKSWRFFQGYIKKSGSTSQYDVDKAHQIANLKTGVVGVQVKIMPPTIQLPDNIELYGAEVSEAQMRVEAAKAGGAALPKVEDKDEEEAVEFFEEPTEELIEESVEEAAEKPEEKDQKDVKDEKAAKKKTAAPKKKQNEESEKAEESEDSGKEE